jgi:hypothetical protein
LQKKSSKNYGLYWSKYHKNRSISNFIFDENVKMNLEVNDLEEKYQSRLLRERCLSGSC